MPYTGADLEYAGNGQFVTVGEAFDACFTDGIGTGHTYKEYDLYWTASGFREYGGIRITRSQLLKIQGAQPIQAIIQKAGNTIDDIYYRANGILNINYHTGSKNNGDYGNITLQYKNRTVKPLLVYGVSSGAKTEKLTVKTLNDFSFGGIYLPALFPKIATYPAKFPGS